MNNLLMPTPGVGYLMGQTLGGRNVALPFARDIYLRKLPVVGLPYHAFRSLDPGSLTSKQLMILRREPENPHDRFAIAVKTNGGQMLGYLPRSENRVFARLMDAGKQLIAKLDYVHIGDEGDGYGDEMWVKVWLGGI